MTRLTIMLTLLFLAGCGSNDTKPQDPPERIALYGDSVAAHGGWCESFPDCGVPTMSERISDLLGTPVTNLATGGETTSDALSGPLLTTPGYERKFGRFGDSVRHYDTVILHWGSADAVIINDYDVTMGNMIQLIDIAQIHGVRVILVGVTRSTIVNDALNEGMQVLADTYDLSFVDIRVGDQDVPDGIHPSPAYTQLQAELITEVVKNG